MTFIKSHYRYTITQNSLIGFHRVAPHYIIWVWLCNFAADDLIKDLRPLYFTRARSSHIDIHIPPDNARPACLSGKTSSLESFNLLVTANFEM